MDNTFYLDTSANIPYAISYETIPPPSMVGTLQQYPFKLTLSASDNGVHKIDLYAQYSNSKPYPEQSKWSHLVPSWKFLDTNQNVITEITTTDTPIYNGSTFMGVTGFAEYYFVDDISSKLGQPAILWATLSVSSLPIYTESKDGNVPIPSYANSKVIYPLPYYINGGNPSEIKITRNGIDSMSDSTYWVNQNIPNIFSLVYDKYPAFGCSIDAIGTLFDYPSSNALGIQMGVISSGITTIPASSQVWTTLDDLVGPYFQKTDMKGFDRGGYSRNIVTADTVTLNTTITAAANVLYSSYKDTPYVWVSNPENNLLHKLQNPHLNQTVISNITSWLDGFNSNGQNYTYNTEMLTARPEPMSLSGFGGIYGIAIDPCFNAWFSDAELDKLYKFNHLGTLVSSIELIGGVTPAGICLDSKNKLWVSLFDSASVLKIDGTIGNLITAINPVGNQGLDVNNLGVDPDYKPTIVQTDKNDNIWVSYTNSLCCYLDKYDENGNLMFTNMLPVCSNPMDLLVTGENEVWVSLTYNSMLSGGSVNKYNSTELTSLCSISANHPEYLTLTNDNILYFTSDYNILNKVDLNTGSHTTTALGISANPNLFNGQVNYNVLEGVAADSTNRIWVVNSVESVVYVLSGDFVELTRYNLPKSTTHYNIDTNFAQISSIDPYEKSLQAFGDWTGLRWQQKYSSSIEQMYITGVSDPFDIDNFAGYDLRKFNESWDVTTQLRDYALNESFHEDYNLFENYIGSMVGGLETSAKSMARALYEKIANFVPNNADVDVCGINQLYSLAKSTDVPIDDYNFVIPSELKRLMDIVSIDHKILWGDHCKCAENYRGSWGYCSNCGHKHDSNRGDALDSDTYVLSAGVPILAEYKYGRDYYEKIIPMATDTVSTFNLYNYVSRYLLNGPDYYCYYEYIPTPCNIQIEGVINWNDEYTTLDETVSGLDDWYGNNQKIEKMINYTLHKGLGF